MTLQVLKLHQLRGRVGRGERERHCVLLYGKKLSNNGKERLRILRESSDGFVIAEKDLELRGPGEFLGTRQAGDMNYRLADPLRDNELLPLVHELGADIYENDPQNAKRIIRRWIGSNVQYANA